ncbi:hypothetical protein PybrP1_001723 [[Pythium] brassicae (nom. inval.)]|nr:hypothetical protein PybrP1_001723 [[Pythium] brassicae (nom. inval.)]
MPIVSRLVRRLLFRHHDHEQHAHLKLRRAVASAKPRQVAALLEQGASPVWRADDDVHELNALLLACQRGDAHVLNLLLDWFFPRRPLLSEWGPPMYCMVIRAGHWEAFLRLFQRNVPQTSDASAKLPLPVFIAAESGRPQILAFLLRQQPHGWREYEFGGHSLLSIASKHGHYECVEVLLASMVPSAAAMDFALDCARKHRQAHVLVLLTSCLPEYNAHGFAVPSSAASKASSASSAGDCPMLCAPRGPHRGSLAETEVMSEYDEQEELERRSSADGERRSHPLLQYGMPFSNESDEAAYQRYNPNRATMDGFALLSAARDAEERARSRAPRAREGNGEGEGEGESDLRHASSGELTWDSSSSAPVSSETEDEDERWYAMKLSEDLILPYVKSNTSTSSEASTDPFMDFDGTFHDAELSVADAPASSPSSQAVEPLSLPPPPSSQSAPQQPPQLYQKPQELYQQPQEPPRFLQPAPPQPVALPLFQAPPASHKVISIRSSNFRSYRTLPSIQEERHPAAEHE